MRIDTVTTVILIAGCLGPLETMSLAMPAPVSFREPSPTQNLRSEVEPYFTRYDLSQMSAQLQRFQNLSDGAFPALNGSSASQSAAGGFAPPTLTGLFDRLTAATFGDASVLTLQLCATGCATDVQSNFESKTIVISGQYISAIEQRAAEAGMDSQEAIASVLAHEIAHYVYERLIQLSPQNRRSSLGHPSLLDSIQSGIGGREQLRQAYIDSAQAHSEIDALTCAILSAAGMDPQPALAVAQYNFERDLHAASLTDSESQEARFFARLGLFDSAIRLGSLRLTLETAADDTPGLRLAQTHRVKPNFSTACKRELEKKICYAQNLSSAMSTPFCGIHLSQTQEIIESVEKMPSHLQEQLCKVSRIIILPAFDTLPISSGQKGQTLIFLNGAKLGRGASDPATFYQLAEQLGYLHAATPEIASKWRQMYGHSPNYQRDFATAFARYAVNPSATAKSHRRLFDSITR